MLKAKRFLGRVRLLECVTSNGYYYQHVNCRIFFDVDDFVDQENSYLFYNRV